MGCCFPPAKTVWSVPTSNNDDFTTGLLRGSDGDNETDTDGGTDVTDTRDNGTDSDVFPSWMKDADASKCWACDKAFTASFRRHHW